jgi:hypothetical protein
MALSKQAEQVLALIPNEGDKLSGIEIKKRLELSGSEYRKAKAELHEEHLIALGKGRGGTIIRTAQEQAKGPSKAEIMAGARAVKKAKAAEKNETEYLKAKAREIGEREFPDADEIQVELSGQYMMPIIFPWYNGEAKAYAIPQREWSQVV